jgi:hypothetical protein
MDRSSFLIVLFLVIPVFLLGSVFIVSSNVPSQPLSLDQITEEPIIPSNPTNVVIRESAIYDAPI